jgi:hypothetical protein
VTEGWEEPSVGTKRIGSFRRASLAASAAFAGAKPAVCAADRMLTRALSSEPGDLCGSARRAWNSGLLIPAKMREFVL